MKLKVLDFKQFLIWLWLVFTVTLAAWQFTFQLRLVSDPSLVTGNNHESRRYLRMIQYENITLLIMLMAGGGALFVLLRRERQKSRAQNEFFATFTHEIKTSLGAIRLRTEALQSGRPREMGWYSSEELQGDLNRLQLQLENSLFLAQGKQDPFLIERLSLKDVIRSLGPQMDLQVRLQRNCWLNVDRRALETIFRNILLNSVLHGQAESLSIESEELRKGWVVLTLVDDGVGPSGDYKRLGELFYRPQSKSGSGIGLYLIQSLCKRMGGKAEFSKSEKGGFKIRMELPGSLHD